MYRPGALRRVPLATRTTASVTVVLGQIVSRSSSLVTKRSGCHQVVQHMKDFRWQGGARHRATGARPQGSGGSPQNTMGSSHRRAPLLWWCLSLERMAPCGTLTLTCCGDQRTRPDDANAGRADRVLQWDGVRYAVPRDQAHLAPMLPIGVGWIPAFTLTFHATWWSGRVMQVSYHNRHAETV